MKILLIEDDVRVAQLLALAFEEEGHVTAISHSGEDGLRCLERESPEALVLDVRLPKMSGIDVLRAVRAMDQTLPVILITGYATQGEMAEARALGALEILEKPHVLTNLSGALARISPEPDHA
jgi:DNA-binding response OmpR family regulator